MANIKDLKKKIKSTKSTLKITQAMKLVSAAKLARAQHAIVSSRPYTEELESTIKIVSALLTDYSHNYFKTQDGNKAAILVISGEKGLCGGYNSQIIKKVRNFFKESELDFKVYFIGKKAKDVLKKEVNIGKHYTFKKADASFLEIQEIADELGTLFSTGEYSKVYVAYNIFESAISFTPTIKQLLPMALEVEERELLKTKYPFDFKYEPAPDQILDVLIPETYRSTIYTCILDATAAEHGSRMSAMDSAVRNCKDAIRTLTLKANKLRQASITTELIEVVSGAESLKG